MSAEVSPTPTVVDPDAPHSDTEKAIEKSLPSDEHDRDDMVKADHVPDSGTFPTGLKLALLIVALELNVFIIALDQTIIAPATPVISNQFNALQDIGWYTSAYLMTTTALQPFYARLFGIFPVKWVFLSTICVFEIGSLVCATAQSSNAFIAGRAVAGTGLAGGYVGTMIIISLSAPLDKIPLYTSLIGVAYGGGAVVGPIIGGALTTEVTWRWCFYMNLPIGGAVVALVIFFLHVPHRPLPKNLKYELLHLDYVGTVLLLAAVTSFLLVCQYGGIQWAWGSSKTIGLIIGFAALMAAFIGWEWYWGDNANIPLRLLRQRTIFWGSITNSLVAGAYFAILTFMSVWFQAVQGSSAIRAGVQTLPFISAAIAFTIFAGVFTTVTGRYHPPMLLGFVCGAIGCGLLYTLNYYSDSSQWIGYQFVAGIVGAAFQLTFVASQTVHKAGRDRERGGSIVIFWQTFGGALFAGAAQVIYSNKFRAAVYAIPGIDHEYVATAGATAFRDIGLSEDQVVQVAMAAVTAIKYSFILGAAASALGVFTTLGMEMNDVRVAPAGGASHENAAPAAEKVTV